MKFKEIIDEELKNKNNSYLENVFNLQFPTFLFRVAKIKILLDYEENAQDKNHWKNEVKNPLKQLLSEFGGVKNKKILIDNFLKNKTNYFAKVNSEFKIKYPDLYAKIGNFTDQQLTNITNEYFPKLVDWIFNSFYKIRTLQKDVRLEEISNCCNEFIQNNFED